MANVLTGLGKDMHSAHQKYPSEYVFNNQHLVVHNIMNDYADHMAKAGLPKPSTPSRMPRYSYALAFWKHVENQELSLVEDDNGNGYIEWPNHKVAFTKDNGEYTMYSPEAGMSGVSVTIAVSAFAYLVNDFANAPDQTPEGFCIAVWYKYANSATVYQELNADINGIINNLDNPKAVIGQMAGATAKPRKKRGKATATTPDFDWDAIKTGAYALNYQWPDETKRYIQPFSYLEGYVPSKSFKALVRKLKHRYENILNRMNSGETAIKAFSKDIVNFALSGPAGSGKTSMLYALSAVFQVPLYAVAVNPNTGNEFTDGETKMVGSELVFVESLVCQWARYGGILLIDELVTANTDMMFGILAELIEFPYHLYSNGCEEVVRHPLAVAAIAYNNGIVGGKTITQPLISRFSQAYEIDKPSRDEFIELLENYSDQDYDGLDKRVAAEWVYDAYEASINYLTSNRASDIATALSIRACFAVLDSIAEGEEPIEALRCFWVLVKHYSEKHANALKNDVYTSLRDLASY